MTLENYMSMYAIGTGIVLGFYKHRNSDKKLTPKQMKLSIFPTILRGGIDLSYAIPDFLTKYAKGNFQGERGELELFTDTIVKETAYGAGKSLIETGLGYLIGIALSLGVDKAKEYLEFKKS